MKVLNLKKHCAYLNYKKICFLFFLAPQTKPRVVQAREFEIGAVRFEQEIGEAPFGKVYRGQLGGLMGGMTSMVAVKTLKSGANQQTR